MVSKMKKILTCLVLVLMLVSSIGVLSACKDKSYNINNLAEDYSSMTSNLSYVTMKDYRFVVDYKAGDETNKSLYETVNNVQPYVILKHYERLLNNELIFANNYIKICSNDGLNVSKEDRDDLKSKMDSLKEELATLDDSLASLNTAIEVYYQSGNIQGNIACLSKLKTTLFSYERVFKSAEVFADKLSNIYFNKAISNSNKNFINVSINDFNTAEVINILDSKIYFEIANLTKIFVEKYAVGQTNIDKYGSNEISSLSVAFTNYVNSVSSLKTNYDVNSAILITTTTNKVEFYNLAVQAYNAFNLINNEIKNFAYASKNIDYASVGADSSDFDVACKNTVNNFSSLVENYRVVISNMLNLMEN